MRICEFDTQRSFKASVVSSRRITPPEAPEVRDIALKITNVPFQYTEGQSIGVITPGPHEFGNAEHFRLYSIASSPIEDAGQFSILVRRCFYVDEVSGEKYKGISSNFLCDVHPGDVITVTGPYGSHFSIPEDPESNLLMIGAGTGMAPFRAFIQRIYAAHKGWQGKVRLYFGAETGMEKFYVNDAEHAVDQYYNEATFKAFQALSDDPFSDPDAGLQQTLENHAEEIWSLLNDPKTHVYLAGLEKVSDNLDRALSKMAGSEEMWEWRKKGLMLHNRWSEVLYV